MRTSIKLMTALLFSVVIGFGFSQTASADVIDAPDPANNIPQVNAGNVLKDYSQTKLNAVDNSTLKGNMDRKYNRTHPGRKFAFNDGFLRLDPG